jgi:hypothetical protein
MYRVDLPGGRWSVYHVGTYYQVVYPVLAELPIYYASTQCHRVPGGLLSKKKKCTAAIAISIGQVWNSGVVFYY